MKNKYLFLTILGFSLLYNCTSLENTSSMKYEIESANTDTNINKTNDNTCCKTFLETCFSCCVVDEEENIVEEEEFISTEDQIIFEGKEFSSIATLLINNGYYSEYYYTNSAIKKTDNEKKFIEFKLSIEEEPSELRDYIIIDNESRPFSSTINQMYSDGKYIFYAHYLKHEVKEKNLFLVKFLLKQELIDFIRVEKTVWKNLGYEIFGESDVYSEFPLVPRLPGATSLNPKNKLAEDHRCLYFPSIIRGRCITLNVLINEISKLLEKKIINNKAHMEEEVTNEFIPEHTLNDLNSHDRNEIEDPYKVEKNDKKKYNGLCFGEFVDEYNITFHIDSYLKRYSNKWSLMYTKSIERSSIPDEYSIPSLIEAIFIMVDAINNNIRSICNEGILTALQGEKADSNYFVKYKKETNSIEISLKKFNKKQNCFIIKRNCGEKTINETGYQTAFVNPDTCCHCPTHCYCHDVLIQNPCWCDGISNEIHPLVNNIWPAIGGCCIYPTSKSWCERCKTISFSENSTCICMKCLGLAFCIFPTALTYSLC